MKDKKMKEMKKTMCEEYGNLCNECVLGGDCANEVIAEKLYNAGYRKIPEEILDEMSKSLVVDGLSNCIKNMF